MTYSDEYTPALSHEIFCKPYKKTFRWLDNCGISFTHKLSQ